MMPSNFKMLGICTYESTLAMQRMRALFSSSIDWHNSEILLSLMAALNAFQYLSIFPASRLAVAFAIISLSSFALSRQFVKRELIMVVWSVGFCWISWVIATRCWIWAARFAMEAGASCSFEHKIDSSLTISNATSASWTAPDSAPRTSSPDMTDFWGTFLSVGWGRID